MFCFGLCVVVEEDIGKCSLRDGLPTCTEVDCSDFVLFNEGGLQGIGPTVPPFCESQQRLEVVRVTEILLVQ